MISVCITICILFVFEIFFYCFNIQSDAFGFTLASQRWFSKYWTPINSFGYRDVKYKDTDLQGKRIIIVVGDSLVAGHGIKNTKDRFSDLLGCLLGDSVVVINVAKCGWDTRDEYHAIVSYPYKPELIILSYYINDIEGAGSKCGLQMPVLIKPIPKIIRPFVSHSYLLNYAYWKLYRSRCADPRKAYWKYLGRCYKDEKVWALHKKDLLKIINYAKTENINLIMIIFPDLQDIIRSKYFTSKVYDFVQPQGVRVIDLTSYLIGKNSTELVISRIDAHPSKSLSKKIATLLLEEVKKYED